MPFVKDENAVSAFGTSFAKAFALGYAFTKAAEIAQDAQEKKTKEKLAEAESHNRRDDSARSGKRLEQQKPANDTDLSDKRSGTVRINRSNQSPVFNGTVSVKRHGSDRQLPDTQTPEKPKTDVSSKANIEKFLYTSEDEAELRERFHDALGL